MQFAFPDLRLLLLLRLKEHVKFKHGLLVKNEGGVGSRREGTLASCIDITTERGGSAEIGGEIPRPKFVHPLRTS